MLDDIRYILFPISDNTTQAADIILLVDESGSMTTEHVWIPEMVKQLDNSLMEIGIGVDPRNRFGVIGFGNDCSNELGSGRLFSTKGSDIYVLAENITELTQGLKTGGKYEDGYSAIASAFQYYTFGDGAKQFILISNEDRDVLSNITRDDIEHMLRKSDVVLNVVVSENFAAGAMQAFGIDVDRTAYIFDPSLDSLFRSIDGIGIPVQDSAHGSTDEDYTQLAFLAEGGSWDLSLLQQGNNLLSVIILHISVYVIGGQVARAFTNSFVHAKVVEIQRQMEECFQCFCKAEGPICEHLAGGSNFSFCVRMPGIGGKGYSLLLLVTSTTSIISFSTPH